ncbi:uroporphyrinogen-III synthase [Robiginitomaculum antarcticum]|uniref:uroporphyrinogen-III synthase n=1 Tax=Robiginitomaculum antarcticum TaxID=437507 RepID=UPI00037D1A31|nr:uroporphyrinogen-III synthase [Robiginitomaculum antarcticum]
MTDSSGAVIWITRTRPGAQSSADAVLAAGMSPIIAPLLRVTATAHSPAAPKTDEALAFTSANGVRAFAALSDKRDHDVYCVGVATGEQARAIGFTKVQSAGGNVDDLAKLISVRGTQSIVHYSGVHVAGDLAGALRAAGLTARREIIYGTQAVTEIPDAAMQVIKSGGYVLLHSPKAAQILMRLLSDEQSANLITVSLSANIDACLSDVFAARYIASAPNDRALMEALEKAWRSA